MSLELVNHQIMRVFGGIQAQKNSSIESLERFQKRLFDSMKKAQNCHKKIHQAMSSARQGLIDLSQNYLNLSKQNKHTSSLIVKIQFEINDMLQKISQECLNLCRKMQTKIQNHLPNFKKLKEKFKVTADNLQHYRQKVSLLKKNVEKQSLAKVSKDQHQRYERNKEKLKKAEKENDEMLTMVTKRFIEFNNEGMKDVYFDLLSVLSTFGGQTIGVNHRITQSLFDSFGCKEIVLAQNLKKQSQGTKVLKDRHNNNETKQGKNEHKSKWLEHLVQNHQIINYLKAILDRELAKVEKPIQIHQIFKKKQQKVHKNDNFNQFKNQYQNTRTRKLSGIKQDDPVSICSDLIQIQQLSVVSPRRSISQNQNPFEAQILDDDYPHIRKNSQNEQKMKQNLQKFDRIIEHKKIHNPSTQLKNHKFVHPHPKQSERNQLTVTANAFFQIPEKKSINQYKQQQKLSQLHEHPIKIELLNQFQQKTPQKQQFNNKMFQTFDFFTPVSQTPNTPKEKDEIVTENDDLLDL